MWIWSLALSNPTQLPAPGKGRVWPFTAASLAELPPTVMIVYAGPPGSAVVTYSRGSSTDTRATPWAPPGRANDWTMSPEPGVTRAMPSP